MKYEWVIVGGGVTGITLSEILTREGHEVLLVERGRQLACETTKLFHEWIHTGSLYTLVPDRLTTLKFLLGAIDDLLEYYSCFERMNLRPTDSGLAIDGSTGWFREDYIKFRYRRRPLNLPWSFVTARSCYLIERIKKHDWLRRRAGVIDEFRVGRYGGILENLKELMMQDGEFFSIESSDFTTNSRNVLRDLVATGMANGLELSLDNAVVSVESHGRHKIVVTDKFTTKAVNVIVCAGGSIPKFANVEVKTSIAPIAVVKGLSEEADSFVELDYYIKRCINLVRKPHGVGLIGGISVDGEDEAKRYMEYVIERHMQLNKNIEIVGTYFGYKHEIVFEKQNRNYLFHIVPTGEGIWAVVPGKFTLGFSLATEFYRRVYHRNPRKWLPTTIGTCKDVDYVSSTLWSDMVRQGEAK